MNGRNPDLPILDELGAEFAAMVDAAYADEGERRSGVADRPAAEADHHTARRRAPLPVAPRTRERGAQARRIGRRAAIMLVLICLVGGVAFAALHGSGDTSDHGHTASTPLGRAADGTWTFSAYRDGGRLCTVFVPRGGELSGSCGPAPGGRRIRAGSAVADGDRYVFGVAGPGVGKADAALGEAGAAHSGGGGRRSLEGATLAPVDRAAAAAAGFPSGDRWFVFDLGPVRGSRRNAAPAVVMPLTRRGRRIGPPYVDCSLGLIGPACRQRIEAAAAAN